MKIVPLHNTKITGSKMAATKELEKERQKHKPHSRIIGQPEVIGMILGFQTVFCSKKFISVPSVSLEKRPAVITGKLTFTVDSNPTDEDRRHANRTAHAPLEPIGGAFIVSRDPPCVIGRNCFQNDAAWRQFTLAQQTQIKDNRYTNISVDAVTNYSCRPPELFFINKYVDSTLYFAYTSITKHHQTIHAQVTATRRTNTNTNTRAWYLRDNLHHSLWVNGFDKLILVRKPALRLIIEKYCDRLLLANNPWKRQLYYLFHALYKLAFNDFAPSMSTDACIGKRIRTTAIAADIDRHHLFQCFVDPSYQDAQIPLPLFNGIKPSNATQFFIHILLSMGTFDTEYDLWNRATIRDVFVEAQLLTANATEDEIAEDLRTISSKYIAEQLLFVPAGTPLYDFYTCEARKVLASIYNTGTLPPYNIPSCLHTVLEFETNAKLTTLKNNIRINMIRALRNQIPSLPPETEFLAVNQDQRWQKEVISYSFLPDQSEQSKQEQRLSFDLITDVIDKYASSTLSDNNNFILHGAPGTGKTHMALLCIAYAMGQALTCMSMALLCERSLLLGGMHYHKFLRVVFVRSFKNVQSVADGCIQRLKRDPIEITFMRSLDILFVDEMGQLSAEQVQVLDIVLRYARHTEAYMGGLLIICAMDIEQLAAINGTPFLMSANIISSWKIIDFQHYVRCRNDLNSQRVCDLCRKVDITAEESEEFVNLILTNCAFVQSMTDIQIPRDALRILGTHMGTDAAEHDFIRMLSDRDGVEIRKVRAKDTESARSSISQWLPATAQSITALNHSNKMREPEILFIYPGAVMEFTHNWPNQYSQGQLCISTVLPTLAACNAENATIVVLAAPVGTKVAPHNKSERNLLHLGWRPISLQRRRGQEKINIKNNMFAQREQFPLHSRVAATIHRAMGCNLECLVTEIGILRTQQGYVRDRGQVTVLLSRTPTLHNIYFVCRESTTHREIAEMLLQILSKKPQYYNYMKDVINRFGTHFSPSATDDTPVLAAIPPILTLDTFPFRPSDMILPDNNICKMGYTYMLLSLKKPLRVIYIGSCLNIAARIHTHNHGFVSEKRKMAPPAYRPWALLGFVCGFTKENQNQIFERRWQFEIRRNLEIDQAMDIIQIKELGETLTSNYATPTNVNFMGSLRFQECGKLQYVQPLPNDDEPLSMHLVDNN